MILNTFIITLTVNVAGDVLLIPLYKNEGAAFAFLLSCLAQTLFFLKKNQIAGLNSIWHALVICTGCALCSGFAAKMLPVDTWMILPLSILIYGLLLLLTAQIRLTDRKNFTQLLGW